MKLTIIAFALSFAAPSLAAGKTDIIRIDGTVFKAPDTRPASRVKDREHPTKERRAKVRETAPKADSKASMPKDTTGCMIVTEIVEMPDGRTVIHDSWRCEKDISRKGK